MFMKLFSIPLILEHDLIFIFKTNMYSLHDVLFDILIASKKIIWGLPNIPQCPFYFASQWPPVWKTI